MGYRSQVMIGIEVIPECSKLIDACKDAEPDSFTTIEGDGCSDILRFEWTHVKWYDSFEDVARIMIEVHGIDEIAPNPKYPRYPFGMFIIGEDWSDIEYHGDPWSVGIQLNRYLTSLLR